MVASASALFRRVMPAAPFAALCQVLQSGTTIDREQTVAQLLAAGYTRAPVVEDPKRRDSKTGQAVGSRK